MPARSHKTMKGSSFCRYRAMNFTRSFMGEVSFHGMPQHAGVCYPCPRSDLSPMSPVRTQISLDTFLVIVVVRQERRVLLGGGWQHAAGRHSHGLLRV